MDFPGMGWGSPKIPGYDFFSGKRSKIQKTEPSRIFTLVYEIPMGSLDFHFFSFTDLENHGTNSVLKFDDIWRPDSGPTNPRDGDAHFQRANPRGWRFLGMRNDFPGMGICQSRGNSAVRLI